MTSLWQRPRKGRLLRKAMGFLRRAMPVWETLSGAILSAGAAMGLCTFFQRSLSKPVLLALCLAFVMIIAVLFGSLAGILGTISAALIFAVFLFEPLHSLAVGNPEQKSSLGWMLIGGIVLSGFVGKPRNAHPLERHDAPGK